MPSLNESVGVIQFVLYIFALILGIGVSYGAITIRLNSLEEKSLQHQADHEVLIVINTKMNRLAEDFKELKTDLKELQSEIY